MKIKILYYSVVLNIILWFGLCSKVISQEIDSTKLRMYIPADSVNWSSFKQKLSNHEKVNIVFLGDSHIQGDYFTGRVRDLINNCYGIAGRGILFPYNLAKSNNPDDYRISSANNWDVRKWNTAQAFTSNITGYDISTTDTLIILTLAYRLKFYQFDRLILYTSPVNKIEATDGLMSKQIGSIDSSINITQINLNGGRDSCIIRISPSSGSKRFYFYGIQPVNTSEKMVVNALGINGISYQYYNQRIHYLPWLQNIHPDCIVISLGTNDIFPGRPNYTAITNSAREMIIKIKMLCPNATLILTSPNDHLIFRKYPNNSLPELSKLLQELANQYNCVYWDFYGIMGGLGSVKHWYHKKLVFKDYVHLSKSGYKLQGELFFQSLQNTLLLKK